LVWSYKGDRYFLALRVADTKLNRAAAQMTAAQIEEDIRTQNFDKTLKKYQSGEIRTIGAGEMVDRYIKTQRDRWQKNTVEKHQAIASQLREIFGHGSAELSLREAQKFVDYMVDERGLAAATINDRLTSLRAIWDWGANLKYIETNHWHSVKLRKHSTPKPKPFTTDEVRRILDHFRNSKSLEHYADLVEFRMRTGMRTGEIVGLQWKQLSVDCSTIIVNTSVSKGERKGTKTGEVREFRLSPQVTALLLKRRDDRFDPDALVFPGVKGAVINANNFSRNQWKPALEALGIPFRRPYLTRSTFVSHALDQGMPPSQVAEISGHSLPVMYKSYLGSIRNHELPELWGDDEP
jgi:integrase